MNEVEENVVEQEAKTSPEKSNTSIESLRDIEIEIFVVLDSDSLERAQLRFTGMQERTHSRFTRTLRSNPGHNFSHEDYIGFLTGTRAALKFFAPIFGQEWLELSLNYPNEKKPQVIILTQGIEISWKNHSVKLPLLNRASYSEAYTYFYQAYNQILQQAELTMTRTTTLQLQSHNFELLRLIGGEIQQIRKSIEKFVEESSQSETSESPQ